MERTTAERTRATAARTFSVPLRVAHVLTSDAFGGTEMQLAGLLERLDQSQMSSVLLTLAPPGPVAARLSGQGIEVHSLGGRGMARALVALAAALRAARPQVVAAYGFKASLAARVLVRALLPHAAFVCGVRGRTVTATEDPDGRKARFAMWVERRTSRLVDAYDANSPGALERLAQAGIDPQRMHCIPNGIDAGGWRVRPARPPDAVPRVVCVGRLVATKHVGDLISAAAILARSGVEATYAVAGDGPMRDTIAEAVAADGLEDRVQLLGTVAAPDIPALLADADLFCLPSVGEGMAGAVMEAMASGLAVVGTDVNGIRELVEHEVTGLLVPPGAPATLAAALDELLADEPRRRAMGERGRERVEREFGMQRLIDAKIALYRSLARTR